MRKNTAFLMIFALISLFVMRSQYAYADEDKSSAQTGAQSVKKIDVEKAHELIEEKKGSPDLIILDVRTKEEYSEGHIEDSVNIDVKSESFKDEIGKLEKSKSYIVHCRTGRRSDTAVKIMEEMGFRDIYKMEGGIVGWQAAGFPVTTK
ncbi:MAG: rhodanese-like domain-containing protein [Thermodesulfobacteriota bacterium]